MENSVLQTNVTLFLKNKRTHTHTHTIHTKHYHFRPNNSAIFIPSSSCESDSDLKASTIYNQLLKLPHFYGHLEGQHFIFHVLLPTSCHLISLFLLVLTTSLLRFPIGCLLEPLLLEETSQGAWNPMLSTAPTVLNNRLLFTSSTNERCSNWLCTSTSDLFLVNLQPSLPLEATPWDNPAIAHWLCLYRSPPKKSLLFRFSTGQNLEELWILLMLVCWSIWTELILVSFSSLLM